jgi:hypothetical protein
VSTVTISADRVTDENVEDIMDTAAYGGITYWATNPPEAVLEALPDGVHLIQDGEDDDKRYRLTTEQVRQAVLRVARNEPRVVNSTIQGYVQAAFANWTEEDGIDCGDIDADAADCIVQVACFGEITYG